MKNVIKKINKKDGVTVIEIVLILVVLIALVLIFKNQLTSIIQGIFEKIHSSDNSV